MAIEKIIHNTKPEDLDGDGQYNLDNGSLVSDNIIADLIVKIISEKKFSNRLVFDGYPRNLNQAKNMIYSC